MFCDSGLIPSASTFAAMGHLDGYSGNPASGDRLDRPSSRTDVDVLFQAASSVPAAKYAVRIRQLYWTWGCAALPYDFSYLQRSFSPDLGTRRWKSLQRWTYAAFILTAVHSVAYQLVEKRHLAWVFLFTVLMIAVATVQILGFLWAHKAYERQSRRLAIPSNQDPPSRNCD
jgi:hypothetical protein